MTACRRIFKRRVTRPAVLLRDRFGAGVRQASEDPCHGDDTPSSGPDDEIALLHA